MKDMITDTERFSQADATIYTIAHMSLRNKALTSLTISLISLVFVVLFIISVNLTGTWQLVMLGITSAFASIASVFVFLIWFIGRPSEFRISKAGLEIVWPGRNRKLPKSAFYEVFPVTDTELGNLSMKRCIRCAFGCFGAAKSKYLGNFDVYTTRNDGFVFIRLKNRRPLLLTPQNPRKFIEELCGCISDDNS